MSVCSANIAFANMHTTLQCIIAKFDRRVIYTLPKDQFFNYNWKYLISVVFRKKYNLSKKKLMMTYHVLCKNKYIYTGSFHTVLRCVDGTIMSTGLNEYGELGHGDTNDRHTFEKVKGIKNVIDVVCGFKFTIVRLANGKFLSCGRNEYGQLGHGDKKNRSVFEEIKNVPHNVVDITCGDSHVILRCSDGKLWGCGEGISAQFGDRCENKLVFTELKCLSRYVVDVICNHNSTVVKYKDGTLATNLHYVNREHDNNEGLCNFSEIKGIPKDIKKIYLGSHFTIVECEDGKFMSCGLDSPLRNTGINIETKEFNVMHDIPKNVTNIVCEIDYIIMSCNDGTVYHCGLTMYGSKNVMLRHSYYYNKITNIPKKHVVEIANCGMFTSFIRFNDGTIMCYGLSVNGQLGVGNPITSSDNYRITKFKKIKGVSKKKFRLY